MICLFIDTTYQARGVPKDSEAMGGCRLGRCLVAWIVVLTLLKLFQVISSSNCTCYQAINYDGKNYTRWHRGFPYTYTDLTLEAEHLIFSLATFRLELDRFLRLQLLVEFSRTWFFSFLFF